MMLTWLLQIAMNGLSQSPSPTPVARRRLRCPARASPFLIVSERMAGAVDSAGMGGVRGRGSRGRPSRERTPILAGRPAKSKPTRCPAIVGISGRDELSRPRKHDPYRRWLVTRSTALGPESSTMPCSPEQLAANRENALRSSGPRTEAGKAQSRRNSLKHGLTGQGIVIPEDDAAEVERRADAFEAELKPTGDVGRFLARRVAALSVRLERSGRARAGRHRPPGPPRRGRFRRGAARPRSPPSSPGSPTTRPPSLGLRRTPEGIDALIAALGDAWSALAALDDEVGPDRVARPPGAT